MESPPELGKGKGRIGRGGRVDEARCRSKVTLRGTGAGQDLRYRSEE